MIESSSYAPCPAPPQFSTPPNTASRCWQARLPADSALEQLPRPLTAANPTASLGSLRAVCAPTGRAAIVWKVGVDTSTAPFAVGKVRPVRRVARTGSGRRLRFLLRRPGAAAGLPRPGGRVTASRLRRRSLNCDANRAISKRS